jgi:hypothetical protein
VCIRQGAPLALGPIRCTTFGAPAVFSLALATQMRKVGVMSVVLAHDIIPRMCIANVTRTMGELAAAGVIGRTSAGAVADDTRLHSVSVPCSAKGA